MAKKTNQAQPTPTPTTHMFISFGWGERYVLPIKAATEIVALMAQATKVNEAVTLVDNAHLYTGYGQVQCRAEHIHPQDEFALNLTSSTQDIADFGAWYKATRELGGDEAVAYTSFNDWLAAKP